MIKSYQNMNKYVDSWLTLFNEELEMKVKYD